MTEAEWLACGDPAPVIEYLVARGASARGLVLAACAFARRHAAYWGAEHYTQRRRRGAGATAGAVLAAAVGTFERRHDGAASEDKARAARDAAATAAYENRVSHLDYQYDWHIDGARDTVTWAGYTAVPDSYDRRGALLQCVEKAHTAARGVAHFVDPSDSATEAARVEAAHRAELRALAGVLREIFGNPFHPVTFSPQWRTDTVVTLARTMYESGEFSPMPILADALQDAGCEDETVLNHCRDTNQVHVRGCWVVDLVLGKE